MIALETEWNFLELSQFDGNSCMPHQAGDPTKSPSKIVYIHQFGIKKVIRTPITNDLFHYFWSDIYNSQVQKKNFG